MHEFAWYILWPCFIFGQSMYVLKRAAMAVRNPQNGVTTRVKYLEVYWDILLYRAVFAWVLFYMWSGYPDLFTQIASHFGVELNLTIPPVPPVAILLGLFSDVLLDWVFQKIPFLSRDLPPLNGH